MTRVDPDYDPREPPQRLYIETNGVFQKWMLTVMSILVVGAIAGGVSMFGKLTAIETRLNYLEMQCYSRAK